MDQQTFKRISDIIAKSFENIASYDRPTLFAKLAERKVPFKRNESTVALRQKLRDFLTQKFKRDLNMQSKRREKENQRKLNKHYEELDKAAREYFQEEELSHYSVEIEFSTAYLKGFWRGTITNISKGVYFTDLSKPEYEFLDRLKGISINIEDEDFNRLKTIIRDDKFRQKLDDLISVVGYIKILNIEAKQRHNYKIGNQLLERDGVEFINNPYIDYKFNGNDKQWKPNYTSKYILDNYRPNACLYSIIIDTWGKSFNHERLKKHKLFNMTYASLYRYIHKEDPTPTSSYALSLDTLKERFLDKFQIQVIAIDVNCNIVWTADYEKPYPFIRPNPLFILVHNSHVYKLTADPKSLAQLFGPNYHEKNLINTVTNYKIPDFEKKQHIEFINDYQQLQNIMTADLNNPEPIPVKLAANNLMPILFDLLAQKYEPNISVSNDSNIISRLFIKTDKNNYTISRVVYENVGDLNFTNTEHYQLFNAQQNQLYKQVINKNTKSYYSTSVMKALENYNRSAVWGFFESNDYYNAVLDISKDYTKCLMEIPQFPVFTQFDEFQPYNGKIIGYSFYLIEVEPTVEVDLILVNKKYEFVSGYVLQVFPPTIKYKILYQLTPYKFVKNTTPEHIKNLYESALTLDDKKSIPNILSGLLLKKIHTKTKSHLFVDETEANHYYDNQLYKITNEQNDIFVGIKSLQSRLTSGFYFIGHLIYDFARIKLFKLASAALTIPQTKLIGVKTDAVFIRAYGGEENPDIKFPVGEFELKTDDTFDSIGKIKYDNGKLPYNHITFNTLTEDHLKDNLYVPKPPTVIELDDEYDQAQFEAIFKQYPRVLVGANYPGCGKTTSFLNYSKGKNAVIVTPYNNLRQNLQRSTDVPVRTLAKILGEGVEDNQKGQAMDLSEVEMISFDEILLHKVNSLAKIEQLLNQYPNMWVHATGDEYQNKPIEVEKENGTKSNVSTFAQSYYVDIINRMFPVQIRLKVNKRIKTDEDRTKFYALFDELLVAHDDKKVLIDICKKYLPFVSELSQMYQICVNPTNVVLENATADIVNSYFRKQREMIPGDRVVCKKHYKKSKYTFYVNVEYAIESFGYIKVQLKDDDGTITELDTNTFLETFKLPYARTCHSLQGLTTGDYLNVFDVNHFCVTKNWLITALSRCRTLNIRIFDSKIDSENFDIFLNNKIISYKEQDKAAGRYTDVEDYITVPDFKLLLGDSTCVHCGVDLDRTNMTLDRVDDELPHIASNCVLSCHYCNISHKNRI
jgi:hypothetical protein